MRFLTTILFCVSLTLASTAQWSDTLTLLHYNILNYRNSTTQCNGNTNSSSNKESHLEEIITFTLPDIFTVNEMGSNPLNVIRLLDNSLNQNGRTYYKSAEFSNNGFSSLVNMLYFNSEKLALYSQDEIEKDVNGFNLVRLIDRYTLYLKKEEGLLQQDTTFIDVFVAHLKASSGASDKTQRANATEALMKYIDDENIQNQVFFAGDFNVQSGSEESFQNLINNSGFSFKDPKNAVGTWNNSSNYKNLHTQSTRASNTNGGCFSGGGMDDRFDFILCSGDVLDGGGKLKYIDQSYWALGNDGKRLNNTINAPTNTSVPANIVEALLQVSDHLPVIMKATYTKKTSSVSPFDHVQLSVYPNPTHGTLHIKSKLPIQNAQLFDATGKMTSITTQHAIDVSLLSPGVYTLRVSFENGFVSNRKVVVAP